MGMHSLVTSLEAIERVCSYKKGKLESSEKPSHRSKKGKKRPGTKAPIHVPKKDCFEKHCNLCKKHGGAIPRTTHVSVVGLRRMEGKSLIFMLLRKAVRNLIP
jgi:hypothetical protein